MTPCLHGALIASEILNNKEHYEAWKKELKDVVSERLRTSRKRLREELERLETPGDWKFLTDQIGMMTLSGLS